jgi:hypothetical protein
MVEYEANMTGLQREWIAARIFAAIGLLLLIAVGVYIGLNPPNSLSVVSLDNPNADAERRQAAVALCSVALTTTQGFAIVPAYTRLASDMVQEGSVPGRYTCYAQTDAAKYQITFDLMCKDLSDAKCINLFSVTQDGSGSLYQRH